MSKLQLPKLDIKARPGISFDTPKSALAKWNPLLQARSDEATITIYDVIGNDEFGGVSAKRIASALRAIGPRDVTVNINSPGGDVFEGIAIYNLLRDHPYQVTVRVVGLAASAASIVAMSGDRIEMARASFMMIHNVWVLAIGNRNDLREIADWIEPFDDALADVYATRTGMEKKAVAKLMDKETWMNGSQAIDNGFADGLMPADEVDESEEPATNRFADAVAIARGIDAAMLKGGVRRNERVALMNALREALSNSTGPEGSLLNLPKRREAMTEAKKPGEEKPAGTEVEKPQAAAPAAPAAQGLQDQIAAAVKADRQRMTAILALDEAKGREKLAQHLAYEGMSVEAAKAALTASPKASSLASAMEYIGSPNVPGNEPEGGPEQAKPESVYDIYARRKREVAAARGERS